MRNLLILILLLMTADPSWASTYYISKSTGADTNNGTVKGTPWAHIPGMASCTSNCASYRPVAGDTFVLMGCDTWVNSDLPVLWDWSGSSGHPITITVDKTWYNASACPSTWNRPIWDGQKATITGSGRNNFVVAGYGVGSTSYVTLDNIEMKGLYCAGACTFSQVAYIVALHPATNWILSNLYLHGWNVGLDGNCFIVEFNAGALLTTSVIDGSDATGASPAGATCYAIYPGMPSVTNSVIHDLANGIVGTGSGGVVEIGGNLIYNILESNSGSHPNGIETLGPGTYYIHDNVIHDLTSGAETLMFGNTGETDYIWNNVFYNSPLATAPTAPQNSGMTGMTFYAWNNTVVPGAGAPCFLNSSFGGTFTAVTIENNHCISTGSVASAIWGGTTPTLTTNLLQAPTVATAQGYTSSETYAYSPASGSGGTVGTGSNRTSLCLGPLSGLCSDTAYAVIYKSTTQTVTVPGRTPNGREPSGPWDVGAYQTPPQPASNLQAKPY